MKISELTKYKQNPAFAAAVDLGTNNDPGYTAYNKDAIVPLINRLEELGWNNIGKGYEGLVFSNPSKSYVIKLYVPSRNSLELIQFITNNQSNRHVPKLRGKPVKIKSDSPVYMIRMEKLDPVMSKNDPIFAHYFPPGTTGDIWDLFSVDINWLKEHQPDFYQIVKFVSNVQNEPDLHIGNIMKRKNTFVLIDL